MRSFEVRKGNEWEKIKKFRNEMKNIKGKHKCIVYNDPEKRLTEQGCGSYFKEVGKDTYPIAFQTEKETCIWEIIKCEDGKWRASITEDCGYYLENSTVMKLVESGCFEIIMDETSGEFMLIDCRLMRHPIIENGWKGGCTRCGKCCMRPRPKTGLPCKYLERMEDVRD